MPWSSATSGMGSTSSRAADRGHGRVGQMRPDPGALDRCVVAGSMSKWPGRTRRSGCSRTPTRPARPRRST
jgi:hypothetical protein